MDLHAKRILILGGSGLVGTAIARQLLQHHPSHIVLVALTEDEVRAGADALAAEARDTVIECEWGNVFLPEEAAQATRRATLEDDALRRRILHDLFDDFSDRILERSFLHRLIARHRPDAVIDCVNTATAFAYQDVFSSARSLLEAADHGQVTTEVIQRHVLTLTMPQLIRHTQIALESMRRVGTQAYVKIGTSGTGGMGLNIPYTHSEERPSRTLLTKSAVAGAQSMLLFLMGRTPHAPAAIEIKPTAAIAWRRIAYGPVRRSGREIPRYDCPEPIELDAAFANGADAWVDAGGPVKSVFIDVGENGVFARDEFETVTALGQMEFITPEEVAEYVVLELEGRASGRNVVAALDSATAGPTYTAGALRSAAIDRLEALERSHGTRSVAFEMLGPPRLTKLLYESFILSRLCDTVHALAAARGDDLAAAAAALVAGDRDLRSVIISIGLPILLPDGKLYRAEEVLLTPDGSDLDRLVARGWVDLRGRNMQIWVDRARRMVEQAEARAARADESGSNVDWHAIAADAPIAPAQFAKWIFRYEDDGERIKR